MPNVTWNQRCDACGVAMRAFAIPSEEWEQIARGDFALCLEDVTKRLGRAPTILQAHPSWRTREMVAQECAGHPQLFQQHQPAEQGERQSQEKQYSDEQPFHLRLPQAARA